MQDKSKAESRSRSLPFIERFKNKIIKIDRLSGLVGALGAVPGHPDPTLSKSQPNKRLPRSDPQLAKRRTEYPQISQHEVVVNRFRTEVDEEHPPKENQPSNCDAQGRHGKDEFSRFSRIGKWKLCLNMDEEGGGVREEEMKVLILPKISHPNAYQSEAGSRIRQKIQKKKIVPRLDLPRRNPVPTKLR